MEKSLLSLEFCYDNNSIMISVDRCNKQMGIYIPPCWVPYHLPSCRVQFKWKTPAIGQQTIDLEQIVRCHISLGRLCNSWNHAAI